MSNLKKATSSISWGSSVTWDNQAFCLCRFLFSCLRNLAGTQVDANSLLELYNILYDFFKVEHSRIIQEPPAHRETITLHRRCHVKFGKVFENYIANLPLSIEIPSWQGYPWQKLSPRQSECSASILFYNSTTIFLLYSYQRHFL